MDIVEATSRFEAWLEDRTRVVRRDLAYKHEQMRADPFLFFRATYYRWAQLWPEECPKFAQAAEVRAVADLHLENFGTWRDAEGRLTWGVNDFDEACPLAFTNDLARLAVSTLLAAEVSPHFPFPSEELCEQIWAGYVESIARGGEPFTLMESHPKLRAMALQEARQPAQFWARLLAKTVPVKEPPPDIVRKGFCKMLPRGAEPEYRVLNKPKGLGSLGRRRFLALVHWQGGMLMREAKPAVPSAWHWAAGRRSGKSNGWIEPTVDAAVRCADPFYRVRRGWLVRRLGPDCFRIDLDELVQHSDILLLLRCMGAETANVHLGTPKARKRLAAAARSLPKGWLGSAAHKMLKLVLDDWHAFRHAA